ncbi:hypothetical protein [Paraclostridium sordellii]|uniref:Uncharacterized protein n=1 Tax=Paraclostridium sordellii TaxID=1505 RepID=A0A0C7PQN7_PARSO|nr:hypothetical protein [Paeniclostridium sordellii]QYE98941.1 hypothetical protein KZ987_05330 [Paeniclostridium sordellii]CEN77716.1 Uncharacterised protein [[Clostridium] sordellii] [Paeniclostridium sordellii]CEO06420.1 Uncharacterised protein [[Clostridium] sordellii] [Paeniclostridium sordellii]CEP86525.1 Uncharacterised protein [[Clostridium] sordellii] [Paeniclostridium sordellii]CEP96776.1 Uncharacterised protein [[Clostridium] sordellii] [Paeniclostridium sordellii]
MIILKPVDIFPTLIKMSIIFVMLITSLALARYILNFGKKFLLTKKNLHLLKKLKLVS